MREKGEMKQGGRVSFLLEQLSSERTSCTVRLLGTIASGVAELA